MDSAGTGPATGPVAGPPGHSRLASAVVPYYYPSQSEQAYLEHRTRLVRRSFPHALGVDDFMQRVEVALHAFGFSGDNSIGERGELGVTLGGRVGWQS